MTGTVTASLEAALKLSLRGPSGTVIEVDSVLDTGYTGSLTLPDSVATAPGLTRRTGGRAVLADGSALLFDSYSVEVWWHQSWRRVAASALGAEILVGMRLLEGAEVRIAVVAGGAVEVVPLGAPALAPDSAAQPS